MAQGPSDTILVAIWITLRIRESKVRNPDRQRFVLSEHIFVVQSFDHSLVLTFLPEFPRARSFHCHRPSRFQLCSTFNME